MADSVGVFIPILQEAAENIRESVDEARSEVIEFNKNLLKDDTVSHKTNGMDSVSEEDKNQSSNYLLGVTPVIVDNQMQQNIDSGHVAPQSINQSVIISTTTINTNRALERSTPSPSFSSMTTALDKGTDLSLNASTDQQQISKRTQQQQSQQKTRSSPAKSVTPQQSKQKLQQPLTTLNEKHWYSNVIDFMPINLKTASMFILLAFTVYMTTIWVRSEHRMADKADRLLHLNITHKDPPRNNLEQQPIYLQKSSSRSVYLRDLDEGFLKNTIEPPYADSIR